MVIGKIDSSKKYATSGGAAVPVPKPKPKPKPKLEKLKNNPSTKRPENNNKKNNEAENNQNAILAIYGSAIILFLSALLIGFYLMQPPEISLHEQQQFEASMRIESIDQVPIEYSNVYSDLNNQNSQFLINEMDERINSTLASEGFEVSRIEIEAIEGVEPNELDTAGSSISGRNLDTTIEKTIINLKVKTFAKIQHAIDLFFNNFKEILENPGSTTSLMNSLSRNLEKVGIKGQVTDLKISEKYLEDLKNYEKYVKPYDPTYEGPGDSEDNDFLNVDNGFCEFAEFSTTTSNGDEPLIFTDYTGQSTNCLTNDDCQGRQTGKDPILVFSCLVLKN